MTGSAGAEKSLRMGDLAIAIDDIPLADMSSIQFRNTIQGPVGSSVSLLIGAWMKFCDNSQHACLSFVLHAPYFFR